MSVTGGWTGDLSSVDGTGQVEKLGTSLHLYSVAQPNHGSTVRFITANSVSVVSGSKICVEYTTSGCTTGTGPTFGIGDSDNFPAYQWSGMSQVAPNGDHVIFKYTVSSSYSGRLRVGVNSYSGNAITIDYYKVWIE